MARLIRLSTALVMLFILTACATPMDKARALLDLKGQADRAYAEGDCQTAIPLYRDLANKLDDKNHALLRLGNCLARSQRNAESMEAYQEALQHNPAFVKAWYNLIYMQAQMLNQSVRDMSANIDPTDPAVNEVRDLATRLLTAFEQSNSTKTEAGAKIGKETKTGKETNTESTVESGQQAESTTVNEK